MLSQERGNGWNSSDQKFNPNETTTTTKRAFSDIFIPKFINILKRNVSLFSMMTKSIKNIRNYCAVNTQIIKKFTVFVVNKVT